MEYGGYHTITLNNLAKIDKGTYYSVVVSVSSNSGKSAYILYSLNTSENTHYKSSNGWNSINYAGRIKAYTVLQENEEVEQKTDISSADHGNISSVSFTGKELCPKVNLTLNSQILIENIDFTTSYKNNINVGIAKIIINGIGKYSGSLILEFEILPIDVPIKPNSEIKIPRNAIKLSDINLPAGWQWKDADLLVENLINATAIYVGENKANYKNTTMIINLQKDESVVPNPDNPNFNSNNNLKQSRLDNIRIIIIIPLVLGVAFISTFSLIIIKIKKKKR